MTRRPSAMVAACLSVCVVLTACADDGNTLREPATGATAPPPPTPSTVSGRQTVGPAGSADNATLQLASTAIAPLEPIPAVYTCDGNNVSPPLMWNPVPAGTVELALTVIDTDANGFVHWVVAGIDPSVQAIGEGAVPDGAVQAKNDANTGGWTGPCPPKGSPHHYVFTLYALNTASGLTNGVPGRAAVATIMQLPGINAVLTGTYQRAG